MKSVLIAFAICLISLPVCAAVATPIRDIVTCPGGTDQPPASFERPECTSNTLIDLDTQGRDLWLHARVDMTSPSLSGGPLGLYVSAKAASAAYVNGMLALSNGSRVPVSRRIMPKVRSALAGTE